jgi:hypothetical protein
MACVPLPQLNLNQIIDNNPQLLSIRQQIIHLEITNSLHPTNANNYYDAIVQAKDELKLLLNPNQPSDIAIETLYYKYYGYLPNNRSRTQMWLHLKADYLNHIIDIVNNPTNYGLQANAFDNLSQHLQDTFPLFTPKLDEAIRNNDQVQYENFFTNTIDNLVLNDINQELPLLKKISLIDENTNELLNNVRQQNIELLSLQLNLSLQPIINDFNQNKKIVVELTKQQQLINTQKKIQRVVGVPESEYLSNLASAVVSNGSRLTQLQINSLTPASSRPSFGAGTWNQASDRALPAGSRIKKPKTGSSIHVGVGVDVKHNSYARYLARLKGKNLKVKNVSNNKLQSIINTLNKNKPVVNNKPLPLMIVQQAGKTQNVCACPI